MGLRRFIGSVLAALLLVTTALPALCSECRARKVEQGCAASHEGTVTTQHQRHARAAVMSADCDSCTEHREAAPAELSAGTRACESLLMKTSYFSCGAVDRQVAALNNVASINLKCGDPNGIDSDVPLLAVHCAGPIFRGNTARAETTVANSAYEPRFVSLKI
jgi:hypothetical protein